MDYHSGQTFHVTHQPIMEDPFEQLDGEWTVDLCSCCDDLGRCCYAYWCWPCFLCSLAGKINESKISCCCVPNLLGVYRMKVRSILKIKGDSCNDYCVTSCCPFCAALQMANEIKSRGLGPYGLTYEPKSNIY